jgi:hypothetical protein
MAPSEIDLDTLMARVRKESSRSASSLDALDIAVRLSARLSETADHLIGHFVDEARDNGASWSDIGEHLGTSKQAAQKRFVPTDPVDLDRPLGKRRRQFTPRARSAVMAAKRMAAELGAQRVSNEHLLMALIRDPESLASRVVGASVDLDDLHAEIRDSLIEDRARRMPSVRYSREVKKTLQLAVRQGVRIGNESIGTEHLLLGMLQQTNEPATRILARHGVTITTAERSVRAEHDRSAAA